MPELTMEEMTEQLLAAGWKKQKGVNFWRSPAGKLYLGPYGAWKVMSGKGTSPEYEERFLGND